MQPLFVPEWKWDSISIDFVGALPKIVKGFDSIWVIVDRLTNSTHFIPIKTGMSVVCSRFSGINPLIGFEPSIFELSIFIRGKGKNE